MSNLETLVMSGLVNFVVASVVFDIWQARRVEVDPELCDITATDRAYAAGYREGRQQGRAEQSELTYQAVAPMSGACQSLKLAQPSAAGIDGLATIKPVTA